MPPFLSVIVPTMRVGGINILLDSLERQTFRDFELVLVDGLHAQRDVAVHRYASDARMRNAIKHLAPSPNPFPNCAFCAYANAGIAAARGEVLVFAVDYSRLPPDLLQKHADFHRADTTQRAGLMGPHRYVGLAASRNFVGYAGHEVDRYEADVKSGAQQGHLIHVGVALDTPAEATRADGGITVSWDADPKLRLPPGPITPNFFHAKNESVRREHALAIGGFDTDLDGAHLYQDSDFADRLTVLRGVQWYLDPTAVIDIANPRGLFPYARRSRDHQDNFRIWQEKKVRGYVDPSKLPNGAPMHVVMIYGQMSSGIHGQFKMDDLYVRRGLTGSESSFFNLARGLARRGHEVAVFCDVAGPETHESGFIALPLSALEALPRTACDAVIAWNEPDYLRGAPPNAVKICDQQLNDFGYCQPGWQQAADIWVAPAQHHLDYLITQHRLPVGGARVIPNSVDTSFFKPSERNPKKVVWCSSPDRGLHHLLSMWPDVRARVPDAELHVFYRLQNWIRDVGALGPWANTHPDVCESARRARYVDEALARLRTGWGVTVHDSVPNQQMAAELCSAGVLAYTCDPLRYTEGFGVSALDAAAAGCHVIISDVDALPSVHGEYSTVASGRPDYEGLHQLWVDHIVGAINADDGCRPSAPARYTMERVVDQWEALLTEQVRFRGVPSVKLTTPAPKFDAHPQLGAPLRVRQRAFTSRRGDSALAADFLFWETTLHASWWSMEDEQVVRDRHWHPRKGDLVIDGGAAFGSYALPALALGAHVVAFSPADLDTELLVANAKINPELAQRLMITRDGLGDKDGWFNPDLSTFADQPGAGQWIRVRTLDGWLAEKNMDRVDWIKLDIEGAELAALHGAEQCIRKHRPRILVECHNFHRPTQQPVIDYVLGLGLGYSAEAHPHDGVSHVYFEAL